MVEIRFRVAPDVKLASKRSLAAARKARRLPKLSENTYLSEIFIAALDRELVILGVNK